MCAQSRVGWKQVHAGAKGVNVIVAAQEDLWPEMCENSRRRSGGRGGRCRPQTCKYFTAPPKCNEDTVQRGEQPTGWSQKEKEKEEKKKKKQRKKKKPHPARVHKVISSSGIKQTKQSYTSCNLSHCLHARTFLSTLPPHTHTPQCLWVWQGGLRALSGVKH